jgi:hypothetical protein
VSAAGATGTELPEMNKDEYSSTIFLSEKSVDVGVWVVIT